MPGSIDDDLSSVDGLLNFNYSFPVPLPLDQTTVTTHNEVHTCTNSNVTSHFPNDRLFIKEDSHKTGKTG